jgi:hypothetical protein
MHDAYYDTSCLVKLYIPELGSDRVRALVAAAGQALALTPLHRCELRNAIALKAYRGEIDRDELAAVIVQIDDDIRRRLLFPTDLEWPEIFRLTGELAVLHTPEKGCRTLDILHIAAALAIGMRRFITLDARQRALARDVGMETDW